MTEQEVRAELQRYADMRRGRDELVRRALAAGITKKEIHELSGMSRSTIDRITNEEDHAA
jgi:predicted transcriptional regulator